MSSMLNAFGVLAATVAVVKFLRWLIWYRSYFAFFNSLPGETDFSFIWGNLQHLRGKTTEERMKYINSLMLKHPRFFRIWTGPFRAMVALYHPETIRDLLKTAEPKPEMYNFALPWLGEGLLLANGERWARSRRLLTPAFHFDILKPYVVINNRAADFLLNRIKESVDEKRSFEVFSLISLCTLDVILQCAMSFKDDIQLKGCLVDRGGKVFLSLTELDLNFDLRRLTNHMRLALDNNTADELQQEASNLEGHPYVQAVNELSHLWFERGRNPFMYLDFVYRLTPSGRKFLKQCSVVHSLSERVIRQRKEQLEVEGPPKKRYPDFLDILLTAKDEAGQGLSPREIRNEVDTFMFEGHDTTASAISWILYSLAQHPEHQQKVQAEVDAILLERDSDDIEWEDLPKLEYLSRVIKEGMRLHCPVPFIQRKLTQPATVDGVTLPVGTQCTIQILNLHHNPEVWHDPWTFNPDNFSPENMQNKDTYAFVPFSAGPRNCIGQHFAMNEEKVLLARLLRKYNFSLDESHRVTRKIAAVMRAENGIKMFATPRI